MAASGHSAVRAFSMLRYGARSWCNRMIAATREAPLRQEIRLIGKSSATSSRLRWHGRQISVYRHFGSTSSSHWVNWRGSNGGKRGLLHPRSPTALLQGMLGEIKSKLIAMTTIFGCCTDDVIVYVQCMQLINYWRHASRFQGKIIFEIRIPQVYKFSHDILPMISQSHTAWVLGGGGAFPGLSIWLIWW
jgi:hypothetical protein